MNIHESAEDYLEKILMLQEQKGSVRSIDIAVAMGFSKPSVSVAMKNLRENGYISMDPDGFIKLEQPGIGDCTAHLWPPPQADRFFCGAGR